jgi:hypothetical protein
MLLKRLYQARKVTGYVHCICVLRVSILNLSNAITFMGSVDVAPSLPETEVLKYNLATAPETNPPTGDSTPTYLLSEEWLLRYVS